MIFFYWLSEISVQCSSDQNLYCCTACIISSKNRVNLLDVFVLVLPPTEGLPQCSSPVTEDLIKSFWKHLSTWNLASVFILQENVSWGCTTERSMKKINSNIFQVWLRDSRAQRCLIFHFPMEDHAIFKVSSLNPIGKCKWVSDYPKPNIREKTIRQVFDPTADCSQMGTRSWYITNTTEEPLVSVKTPVLQVWQHSALFYPTHLNERQTQRQISCIISETLFLHCVFLWVLFPHREGTTGNHRFEAVHRQVPAICPVKLNWYRQKFHLFSSTDGNQLQLLFSPVPSGSWE